MAIAALRSWSGLHVRLPDGDIAKFTITIMVEGLGTSREVGLDVRVRVGSQS